MSIRAINEAAIKERNAKICEAYREELQAHPTDGTANILRVASGFGFAYSTVRGIIVDAGLYSPRQRAKKSYNMRGKIEVNKNERYSVYDAAAVLGISPTRMYTLCRTGKIPFGVYKANGRRFIMGADIEKFWRASI